MDLSDVAIATITWPRSFAEEELLSRSLTLLAQAGCPVVAADRGTSATFTAILTSIRGVDVVVPAESGLVAQVKASVARAAISGRRFVLYVEPDKETFFRRAIVDFVHRAPDGSDVGVVLASRSDESFYTFPPVQRYTEGVINHLCAQRIGTVGDYSYGPFLMNRSLLPHVEAAESRLGWGWRHFVFRTAHDRGLRVCHVTGEYPCPPDQRDESESERTHRMRQLSQNIMGLIE